VGVRTTERKLPFVPVIASIFVVSEEERKGEERKKRRNLRLGSERRVSG
jgi:hypothetical protein